MLRHLKKLDVFLNLNLQEETCHGRYVSEGREVKNVKLKNSDESTSMAPSLATNLGDSFSSASIGMSWAAYMTSKVTQVNKGINSVPLEKEFGIFHEARILIDDADALEVFNQRDGEVLGSEGEIETKSVLENFISDRAEKYSTGVKDYDLPTGARNTHSVLEDLLPSLHDESKDQMSWMGRLSIGANDLRQLIEKRLVGGENSRERAAMVALSISKLHEGLGLVERRLAVIDEALDLWKFDTAGEEVVGGYTVKEAMAFRERDLKYIIELKSQRSKASVNKACAANEERDEVKCMNDALNIYKWAAKSMDIKDRSIIFPIFSCLFLFIKTGEIKQNKDRSYEIDLVRNFVNEAKLHGDAVHHTRALALEAELYSHLGKYDEALKTFKIMELFYNVQYSDGICEAYGTDRSAQAYSRSALWQMQLGDNEGALAKCEHVITQILPNMNPRNVHNFVCLLYPIMGIMKDRAPQRMKELFEEYVIDNYDKYYRNEGAKTPCAPMFDPLTLLLGMCADEEAFAIDPHLESYISWGAEEKSGVCSEFLDSIMSDYGWAPHTMTADMCLRLSRYASGDEKKKLIAKSRLLTSRVNHKLMSEEDKVVLHAAFAENERVRKLAMKAGRHTLKRYSMEL